jgi:hypothetical protein
MTNVTRAKVTLIEHDKQSCNTMASQDAVEFISQMEKGKASVRQLLQSESSACIERNRANLKSILKAIVFCGKQNISLRGHTEQEGSDSNPGEWRRKQIIGEDSYFQFPLMEQQIAPIKSSFL